MPIGMPSSSAAASVKALKALPAWRLDCTARLILCLVKFGPPTIARIAPVCGTMLTSEDSGFLANGFPSLGIRPETAASACLWSWGW